MKSIAILPVTVAALAALATFPTGGLHRGTELQAPDRASAK